MNIEHISTLSTKQEYNGLRSPYDHFQKYDQESFDRSKLSNIIPTIGGIPLELLKVI